MTPRELLLQELATTSDELLSPVLEFLRLLKAHPEQGTAALAQTSQIIAAQSSYQEWLDDARQKVAVGLQQIERGEILDGETVIARLQAKIDQVRQS